MIPLATSRLVRRVKQSSLQPELWNRCPGLRVPFWSQPSAPCGFSPLRAPQCPPCWPSLTALLPATFPQPRTHRWNLSWSCYIAWPALLRTEPGEISTSSVVGAASLIWGTLASGDSTRRKQHWRHWSGLILCQRASTSFPPCPVLCKPWEPSLSTLCHGVIPLWFLTFERLLTVHALN